MVAMRRLRYFVVAAGFALAGAEVDPTESSPEATAEGTAEDPAEEAAEADAAEASEGASEQAAAADGKSEGSTEQLSSYYSYYSTPPPSPPSDSWYPYTPTPPPPAPQHDEKPAAHERILQSSPPPPPPPPVARMSLAQQAVEADRIAAEQKRKELSLQLFGAARNGNLPRVQELLALGADPNYQTGDGTTSLINMATTLFGDKIEVAKAVRSNFTEVVESLLVMRADPDKPDFNGGTPRAAAALAITARDIQKLFGIDETTTTSTTAPPRTAGRSEGRESRESTTGIPEL
eukprot:TRINITY_DN19203_c0_g1_i7.p1 TRINITY_DN19203_c0_g1~~TRINITY_DN19203_c0_g1_i7.p1  ORF type:complete len:291 (-),score=82.33 TRINITY_DN19203_c0_g1_i7:81-953(-)